MDNETLGIALTAIGMAAALIWLIIRLATKPLETVVKNNTTAMERLYAIVDRRVRLPEGQVRSVAQQN